jgi:hypothetical protein
MASNRPKVWSMPWHFLLPLAFSHPKLRPSLAGAVSDLRSRLQRKDSIRNMQNLLQNLQSGLFQHGPHQKHPEEVIYELFKISNKSEASIGKLLTVRQ